MERVWVGVSTVSVCDPRSNTNRHTHTNTQIAHQGVLKAILIIFYSALQLFCLFGEKKNF